MSHHQKEIEWYIQNYLYMLIFSMQLIHGWCKSGMMGFISESTYRVKEHQGNYIKNHKQAVLGFDCVLCVISTLHQSTVAFESILSAASLAAVVFAAEHHVKRDSAVHPEQGMIFLISSFGL